MASGPLPVPRRVVTLTLNPALDLATSADHVIPGPKLRCDAPQMDPGGGGINVSRAIRILGGDSMALIVAGGPAGGTLEALLRDGGIEPVVLPAPGPTRESLSVTDRATGRQFRFVMPGPVWGPADTDAVLRAVLNIAKAGDILVMSGSQPPGVPDDLPLTLAHHLAALGADLVLDTSGAALRHVIAHPSPTPVRVLRMDASEAAELAGAPLEHRRDSADFATGLVARGVARTVIVARGDDGSVLAHEGGRLHCVSPRVEVLSKVGAGDSFTGAFVLALAGGAPMAEALRTGVAAAASAVTTEATSLCIREEVLRLTPLCTISDI